MKITSETDIVHDSDGKTWECQWHRKEGYPIPPTTRVRLREPGTDRYTHYYDAPFAADIFKPSMIDNEFRARPL